ncbi:hypothetical protein ACFSTH_05700 [Paenibacillus yanchengensis]|uniref:DUF3221 domain-containing protein n=1 Tax=Paenibacillus yanchengensis TaxID=2035833 RepID=A0ABW4YHL4_9BACL
MTKIIQTTSIILLLLLVLAACSKLPDVPTADEVLSDVEVLAANMLLGETKGSEEKFSLTPLIIEEMDVTWIRGEETMNTEISAFFGDEKWKSEVKQMVTVHYVLNASKQWEAQGVNVNNPVISMIPRQ